MCPHVDMTIRRVFSSLRFKCVFMAYAHIYNSEEEQSGLKRHPWLYESFNWSFLLYRPLTLLLAWDPAPMNGRVGLLLIFSLGVLHYLWLQACCIRRLVKKKKPHTQKDALFV